MNSLIFVVNFDGRRTQICYIAHKIYHYTKDGSFNLLTSIYYIFCVTNLRLQVNKLK